MTTLTLTARPAPRRAAGGARPTARSRTARRAAREPPRAATRAARARASTPSRAARVAGGTSCSQVVSEPTPMPASPTSSGVPPLSEWTTGRPRGERLEDDVRARVVHLRMQEHVRAPVDRRRVALRVAAGEEDAAATPSCVGQLRGRSSISVPVTSSRASGSSAIVRSAVSRRYGCLVAAEQQHRAARRRLGRRREHGRVDGVVQDLPAAGAAPEIAVGGALAELALVDDVVGAPSDRPQPVVHLVRPRAGPAGIGDAVLVDDDRRPPALRRAGSPPARRPAASSSRGRGG